MNDVSLKVKWVWIPLVLIFLLGAAGMLIRPDASEPMSGGLRTVAALFLVLGMAFIGVHLLRRWAQRAGHLGSCTDIGIRIRGVKGLGHGRCLLVVEVDGERLLLGAGRDTIVRLARLPSQESKRETRSLPGEG